MELKIATDALKRMARARGEKQRQAKGITDNLVVRMLTAAGNRRVDLRNKALLTVAYTTMCRRSELVALLREDLQVDSDGWGTVVAMKAATVSAEAGRCRSPASAHHPLNSSTSPSRARSVAALRVPREVSASLRRFAE